MRVAVVVALIQPGLRDLEERAVEVRGLWAVLMHLLEQMDWVVEVVEQKPE
jgi:hypothetical protein